MKCRECHKKVSEYAKVCPYCGAAMTQSQAGNEVSAYLDQVSNDEVKRDRKEQRKNRERVPIRFTKRTYMALASTMIIAVLTVTGYVNKKNQWALGEQNISYITESGLVAHNLDNDKKLSLVKAKMDSQNTRNTYSSIGMCGMEYHEAPLQGYIYYVEYVNDKKSLDGSTSISAIEDSSEGVVIKNEPDGRSGFMKLYRKPINNTRSKPECISSDVFEVSYDKQDNVFYREIGNNRNTLFRYDGHERKEIAFNELLTFRYVEEVNKLFVSSIEEGDTEDNIDQASCTVVEVNPETFETKELFKASREWYEVSAKDQCIYYMYRNILYRYDYVTGEKQEIKRQVEDFCLEKGEEQDYLYYITYKKITASCYDYAIDNFYEKDKKGEAKDSDVKRQDAQRREAQRKTLKNKPFYQIDTELYCYQNAKSDHVTSNVAELSGAFSPGSVYIEAPNISPQEKIRKQYHLSGDGLETADDLEKYYEESGAYELSQSVNSQNLIEYTDESNSDDGGESFKAFYATTYGTTCILYQGKMISEQESPEEYDKVVDTLLSKRKGDVVCKYDKEGESLRISSESNKEETIINNVFAYRLLEDGRTVCLVTGVKAERELFVIEKSGEKRLLAKNVWGLFGEDTCFIKGYPMFQ